MNERIPLPASDPYQTERFWWLHELATNRAMLKHGSRNPLSAMQHKHKFQLEMCKIRKGHYK